MENFTVELLVSNCCGVLGRIASVYSRRGHNIDSLHVDETESLGLSRMLIASKGDEYARTQIVRQLSKLYDIRDVKLLTAQH